MAGKFVKSVLGFFVGFATIGFTFLLGIGGIFSGYNSGNIYLYFLLIPFVFSVLLILSPVYFWILKPAGLVIERFLPGFGEDQDK